MMNLSRTNFINLLIFRLELINYSDEQFVMDIKFFKSQELSKVHILKSY
jgi:hypothetical protein